MSVMTALATGVDYVDLEFLGKPGIIATGVLHGKAGVALVDPGPSTTLETLKRKLDAKGMAFGDVRAILITHIHLDHAGATGTLMDRCPDARVFVHAKGAPHLSDPSGLLASASRLYGADMNRLWGEVRAVPASRLEILNDRDSLEIVGHAVESAYTPGHASHHVSYFLPSARLAFVGDTAGIARQGGRLVIPPTPPPDIDLEAWRVSTDRILAWDPQLLVSDAFRPARVAARAHERSLDSARRLEPARARSDRRRPARTPSTPRRSPTRSPTRSPARPAAPKRRPTPTPDDSISRGWDWRGTGARSRSAPDGYQVSRRTPGMPSKCSSRLSTGSRCCSASAAIHASLAGIGRPIRLSVTRIRA